MAYIELCGMKRTEAGQFFRRQLIKTSDKYKSTEQYRKNYNNTDFYRSVFEYQTDNLDKTLIRGPFILDLDSNHFSAETFPEIKHAVKFVSLKLIDEFCIPRDCQELFFSGSKGFHITVQPEVFGAGYSSDIADHYKRMAQQLSDFCIEQYGYSFIDLKVYDRRRILRVVNSKNSKSGLYKVPLGFYELTTYKDLIEIAQLPREYQVKPFRTHETARQCFIDFCNNVTVKNKREREEKPTEEEKNKVYKKRDLLPCAKKLLRSSISEGNRNNVTVALANLLFQAHFSSDEVWDKIRDWNDNNDPPLSEAELMHTMMSANHMHAQDKKYGCATLKEYGYCEPRNCRVLLNKPR